MKLIVALAALLAAAPVSPTPEPATEGRVSSSIPPERYRALGAVVTVFVPFDALNDVCGVPRVEGRTLMGCARRTKEGVPVVILPDACPAGIAGELYARIVCHEMAHARGGWSGEHEI